MTTMCAPRNANGSQGPAALAQSRNWTAVGSGTSRTTATTAIAAIAVMTIRVRLTCRRLTAIADPTLSRVLSLRLKIGEVTPSKATGSKVAAPEVTGS